MEISDKQIIEAIKGRRKGMPPAGLISEIRDKEIYHPEYEKEEEEEESGTGDFYDGLLNKDGLPAGNKKVARILAESMSNSSDLEEKLILESILELSEGTGLQIMGTIVQADTMSINRNYYPESTLIQSIKDKVWEGGKIFFNHKNRLFGKIKELIGKTKKVFYDPLQRKLKFEAFISKAKTDTEVYKAIKDKLLDISLVAKGHIERRKDNGREFNFVHKIASGAAIDIIMDKPSAVGAEIEYTQEIEES